MENIQQKKKFNLWHEIKRCWHYFNLFEKCLIFGLIALSIITAIFAEELNGEWWWGVIGFIGIISGVVCEILVCKRNRVNFGFSIVNDISEGIIALNAGLYMGAIINFLFWVPNDTVSFTRWLKHKEIKEPIHTKVKTLKWWHFLILFAALLVLSYPAMLLLELLGESEGYIDSLAAFLEIATAILILLRFRDYTFMWLITIALRLYLYAVNGEWLMVIMWASYIVTTIYGYFSWTKNIRQLKLPQKPQEENQAPA